MIALNQPSLDSNLTSKNQVDTYVNNDDNSQSFLTPRNHNQMITDILYTNTTTTQVQI